MARLQKRKTRTGEVYRIQFYWLDYKHSCWGDVWSIDWWGELRNIYLGEGEINKKTAKTICTRVAQIQHYNILWLPYGLINRTLEGDLKTYQ
ncbi:MAG: hypothetical protein FWH27_17420 [Planctomycetaceae bacterium]|nr:hypothetical protein [Planctomycetaceae bacterium]